MLLEQLLDLLRHEHRRRFVEDEDLGAAVQHLDDLDTLAFADLERLDQLVGVDVEPVVARRPRGCAPWHWRSRERAAWQVGSDAEHDVLEHGQVLGQHEVLMHHADSEVDRIGRAS